MKNRAIWTMILGIAAILAVMAFSACDDDPCDDDPCADGHTYQWLITTYPTASADGTETGTCSICGGTETRPLTLSAYQSNFYGEWLCTTGFYPPYNVTISAARFHFIDIENDYVKLDDLTWTPAAYPSHNNDLSATYPAGFYLYGTLTNSYYDDTSPYFVALSADKTTMLFRLNTSFHSGTQFIFNKQ